MTEHVLIVGSPRSGWDLPAQVRRARPGTQTSLICRLDPEHLTRLSDVHEHAALIAVPDNASDAQWIALAAAVHTHTPFTRAVTFTETDQDRCAAIGAALSVPAHAPETVRLVHDKHAMRTRLREAGVDSTPSALVTTAAEVHRFVRAHGLPCIVKPASGAGSVGITLLTHEADIEPSIRRATATSDEAVVEPFHTGRQFSVEAMSEDGDHQIVAVTRKLSDPQTLVELGHIVPADLTDEHQTQIYHYVTRLLTTLGISFGPTHTELVLTPDGPRVIETHLRMGGGQIPQLVHDATGIDLTDYTAQQSAGTTILPGLRAQLKKDRPARYAAVWFATPPAPGLLTAIDGLDNAWNTYTVTDIQLLTQPGTRLTPLDSGHSRLAYARTTATTAHQALHDARQAISHLTFTIQMPAPATQTI
ncbi:ATP-grasp domain-containing protein [Streptomyces sp. NPDC056534]|uniref:ATP-grasp domain-containing protein n=1 Tax=Streptomyces sp. NPDC056534 TaxID=3345857 RepID=UPI0036BA1616